MYGVLPDKGRRYIELGELGRVVLKFAFRYMDIGLTIADLTARGEPCIDATTV